MNVGILGLGFMGSTHLRAFQQTRSARVHAVYSSDPKKLTGDFSEIVGNLGRQTGRVDLDDVLKYTSWQNLIQDPELDAVDICLPTHLHAPAALLALEAGKHVLLEKPMALTAADCDAVLSAADERGLILMVAHVLRFWPQYLRLTDFVQGHGRGSIRNARFERRCAAPNSKPWQVRTDLSGGALLDLLIHDIDQVLHLFGLPQQVSAISMGSIDTVDAKLSFSSGLEVSVCGGWYEPDYPFAMSFRVESDASVLTLGSEGVLSNLCSDGSSLIIETSGPDAFDAEVAYFTDCCERRRPPELCPPKESALAVKLALLLNESRNQEGAPIQCNL